MHKLDKFEDIIAEQLNKQEYAYDASAWSNIEKQLPPTSKVLPMKWIVAASLIISTGTVAFFYSNTKGTAKTELVQVEKNLNSNLKKNTFTPIDSKKQSINLSTESNSDIKEIAVEDHIVANDINETKETSIVVNDRNSEITKFDTPEVNETPLEETSPEIIQLPITHKLPSAKFNVSNTKICLGQTIELTALNELVSVDYLWDFGDGSFSKQKNVEHKFPEAGIYYISLEARNHDNNDVVSISDKIAITVKELPKSEFTTEYISVNHIPHLKFINLSRNANSFDWRFSSGKTSNKKDPVLAAKNKGTFIATLTSINKEGCSSTYTENYLIENDFNLLAPNAFTPNGDGINDNFIPVALTQMNVDFEMNVFDKRGRIYTTRNIDQPWDGINQRDGGKSISNNYIWVVTYTDEKNIMQTYKGTVLLLD